MDVYVGFVVFQVASFKKNNNNLDMPFKAWSIFFILGSGVWSEKGGRCVMVVVVCIVLWCLSAAENLYPYTCFWTGLIS